MDINILQNLDQAQQFDQIIIENQQSTTILKNLNFQHAVKRLQQQLNQMTNSNFYKNITVHFSAKNKQNANQNVQLYEKKIQVLKNQLQAEKQHLKNLISAVNEQELQINQLKHQRNNLIINRIKQQIKYDFTPCFYIQAQKKKPFYGHFTQQFSRRGVGNFVAKLGYRSPFKKYDSLELNVQWPITKIRKKFYQAAIQWSNKVNDYGTTHIKLNSAKDPTYLNIDTQIKSVSWALDRQNDRFEIQLGYRKPFIHEDVSQSILNEFYLPSQKLSFKYNHIFKNTVAFGDIIQGQYSELKTQIGLPFVSQSKFIKLQYNFRKFFDTYWVNKLIDNQLAKKFFWKSTLQTNLSISSIFQYGKHAYVNDALQPIDIRGFQAYKKPIPSYLNVKSSFKFNLHNFPVLSQARLLTFIYTQMGASFEKINPFRPYLTSSLGLGFSLYLNPFAQIQILCNGLQWQNRKSRQALNLQIRFGVFD